MANASDLNYSGIDRPYDSNMDRSVSQVADLAVYDPTTDPYQNLDHTVDAGNFNDLWVANWIKSRNYQPKTQGFFLDGKTGYIEAQSIFIGNADTYISFSPTGGLEVVGAAYYTSKTGARLEIFPYEDRDVGLRVFDNSSTEVFRIMVGGVDTGDVFIGDVGSGVYAQWDNSAGEFLVNGGIITGGLIRTSATGARVEITNNDIYLYDDTTAGVGNFATMRFLRTDGNWASGNGYWVMNGTTVLADDESNILQLFATQPADGAGFNAILIGADYNTLTGFTNSISLLALDSVTVETSGGPDITISQGTNSISLTDNVRINENFFYLNDTDQYAPFTLNYKDHAGVNQTEIVLAKV